MWNREWGQIICAHIVWVMSGHCTGRLECYREGKKLDLGIFLLMGGDLQATDFFFSWAYVFLMVDSWMRNSSRTWGLPCSRNTSSQERRASLRLWTNSNRRCGRVICSYICRFLADFKVMKWLKWKTFDWKKCDYMFNAYISLLLMMKFIVTCSHLLSCLCPYPVSLTV